MRRKKKSKSWILKVIYAICVIIVFIAGLYYENGYKDINTFINDLFNNMSKVSTTIANDINNTLTDDNTTTNTEPVTIKKVNGKLQMHLIDVGQRR